MKTHAQARKLARGLQRAPLTAGISPGHLMTPVRVRQIVGGLRVQGKLVVGPPDDVYEREADRVADAVMRMPEAGAIGECFPVGGGPPRIQRVCKDCEEEMQVQRVCSHCAEELRREAKDEGEEEKLQRDPSAPGVPEATPDLEAQIRSLRGSGQPLPSASRAFFEPRFGQDFSAVRMHLGAAASKVASVLRAKAFTTGEHIVFGEGQYQPGAGEGQRLLAHELTHVVQQQRRPPAVLNRQPEPGPLQSNPEGPQAHVEIDKATGRIIVSIDSIPVLEAQIPEGAAPAINVLTQWVASEGKLRIKVSPGTNFEILPDGLKQLGSVYTSFSVEVLEGELPGTPSEGLEPIDIGPPELPQRPPRPSTVPQQVDKQASPSARRPPPPKTPSPSASGPGGAKEESWRLPGSRGPSAPSGPTLIGPIRPEGAPGNFCVPYATHAEAADARDFVETYWLNYVLLVFGTEVHDLWRDYLDRAKGAGLVPRVFQGANHPIVAAFRTDPQTVLNRDLLRAQIVAAAARTTEATNPFVGPTYRSLPIPLGTLLPANELIRTINYTNPATEIPGNIAGGTGELGRGSSDAGPDLRLFTGSVRILRTKRGLQEAKSAIIELQLQVIDAVDFCPGAAGGWAAQQFTIPMSRLEATPTELTYDLPFHVFVDLDETVPIP